MQASTRRLALRAAAKVAMSLSVAGCGGSIQTDPQSPPPRDDAASPVMAAVGFDATGPVDAAMALIDATMARNDTSAPLPATCVALGTEIDASVSEEAFTCCAGRIGALLGDAGFGALPDAASTEPDVLSCCNAILARLSEDMRTQSPAFSADETLVRGENYGCCLATGNFVGPACEGWGPPVPPEMPAPDALLAEVA